MSSKIQWTTDTWNPLAGCSKISAGCANCYAIKDAVRLAGNPNPKIAEKYAGTTKTENRKMNWTGRINLASDEVLTQPLRWTRPRKIFVNSMSDLFHEDVPFTFIEKVFGVMALCPQHIFQVLTKRPQRMKEFFDWSDNDFCHENTVGDFSDYIYDRNGVKPHLKVAGWGSYSQKDEEGIKDTEFIYEGKIPLPNVWLGTSVENQKAADERIPFLLETPAAIRWLSVEPLLEQVDLTRIFPTKDTKINCLSGVEVVWSETFGCSETYPTEQISWCVVGGESGNNARPCNIDWIRSVVNQCVVAKTPVFVKQLGAKPYLREVGHGSGKEVDAPFHISDKKGGQIEEFPSDLQIREMPNFQEIYV